MALSESLPVSTASSAEMPTGQPFRLKSCSNKAPPCLAPWRNPHQTPLGSWRACFGDLTLPIPAKKVINSQDLSPESMKKEMT